MDTVKLNELYDDIVADCRDIFRKKLLDYGPTWLLFRYVSMVDQLWIKIKRIRTLEEMDEAPLIDEGKEAEYKGIINYAVITLLKLSESEEFPSSEKVVEDPDIISGFSIDKALEAYDSMTDNTKKLMQEKNHDYGNAWESMDIKSITDQIIIKLFRIKNILANGGKLLISENIDAQLNDIINYCVFALIKLR